MRLLLIEDDAGLCERLKPDLEHAGFAVDRVDNGVDGEFMGNAEPYDVVVLDLGLPDRSGLAVLRHWRSEGNPVPVIILTARDAWHERVGGFKAGADDYLGKPFHVENRPSAHTQESGHHHRHRSPFPHLDGKPDIG
jgi:DNA-binding response OmpR family regulator